MACVIKTLQSVKKHLPVTTRLILRTHSLSVTYTILLYFLYKIEEKFVNLIRKQSGWAIETCYDRAKFDSSSDLNLKPNILPVTTFLE